MTEGKWHLKNHLKAQLPEMAGVDKLEIHSTQKSTEFGRVQLN